MKRIRLLVRIGFLISIYGCKQQSEGSRENVDGHSESENNIKTKKWYYDNGKLKKVQQYKNDTIEYGTYLFYYPNGQLEDSAQIIDGKLHGERFGYFENGQLSYRTFFKSGKERSGIAYRSDGTLKYYKAFNYLTDLMFIVEYDSVERVIRHDGHPIFSFHQNNIDSERKVAIELLVAHPPNCISKITVGDWDSSKSQMMGKSEHYPDKFNRVIYDKDLSSDLFIINVAQIQDTVRKMKLTDTLILKVNRSGVEHFKAKLRWR